MFALIRSLGILSIPAAHLLISRAVVVVPVDGPQQQEQYQRRKRMEVQVEEVEQEQEQEEVEEEGGGEQGQGVHWGMRGGDEFDDVPRNDTAHALIVFVG